MSQNENAVWYFGANAGISFQNNAPQNIPGQINTIEGTAVACDPVSGQVLFYTDGSTLYNGQNFPVVNGTGLRSGTSSTQCAMFLPDPANDKRYYLITVPDLTNTVPGDPRAFFTHISAEAPGGIILRKNIPFTNFPIAEKLTAARECNGNRYWILLHHRFQSKIYAFKLTAAGLDTIPVISDYPSYLEDYTIGQMKVSPAGNKLALTSHLDGAKGKYLAAVFLFDFNSVTGLATNFRSLAGQNFFAGYGVAFSPDNNKLYVSGSETEFNPDVNPMLAQFDLLAGDEPTIQSSLYKLPINKARINALQLAPDGKIYAVSSAPSQLDVIERPNRKGDICAYKQNVLGMSGKCRLGLPSVLESSFNQITTDTFETCYGTPVRIGIQAENGYVYSWNPATGLSNPRKSDPDAAPAATTNYQLRIQNPTGCVSYLNHIVKVTPRSLGLVDEPAPLCKGQMAHLIFRGNATKFRWRPAYGLSDTASASPLANPDSTTTYTLFYSNDLCSDTLTVKVRIAQEAIADAGPDLIVCPGGSVQIGQAPIQGYSYKWEPSDQLSSPFAANPMVYNLKKKTQYLLQATSPEGCIAYDTVLISIENSLKASISRDTSICAGQKAILQARGGDTYLWQPSYGLSSINSSIVQASPDTTTRYKVIVKNGDCLDSGYVTVKVNSYPVAQVGPRFRTTCVATPIVLGTKPIFGYKYSWSPSLYLDDSTSAMPTCTPDTPQKYKLTVTNSSGCMAFDTVEVRINQELTLNAGADTAICIGNSVQLEAHGALFYTWFPTTGLDDPYSANPIAKPTVTTTYYVNGKSNGCTGSDSITITVVPKPSIQAFGDTIFCQGGIASLSARGADTYIWMIGTDTLYIGKTELKVKPSQSTTYTVIGQRNGCFSNIDSVIVSILDTLQITALGDTTFCRGGIAVLRAIGGKNYRWTDGSGKFLGNSQELQVVPAYTQTYYVSSDNGICTDIDSVKVTVLDFPKISVSADTAFCSGGTARLSANGAKSYRWYPAEGLDNPNIANPIAQNVQKEKVYYVIGSNDGCEVLDSIKISIFPRKSYQFLLSSTGTYKPGENAVLSLQMPGDLDTTQIILDYDNCCSTPDIPISQDMQIEDIKFLPGAVHFRTISKSQKSGLINIPVKMYQPVDNRIENTFAIRTNYSSDSCRTFLYTPASIKYNLNLCAWNIRGVLPTGIPYLFQVNNGIISMQSGLGGTFACTLYSTAGSLLWKYQQYMGQGQKMDIQLPTLSPGLYALKAENGPWHQIELILINE
jgi:hypothetical protein